MDSRGFLKITGRIKDMIIRGGENVYPREIENLLLEHPGVAMAAIIGVPNAFWGEEVGAAIPPKSREDPPSPSELHEFCRSRLAAYKHRASGISWIRFRSRRPGSCRNSSSCRRLAHGAWRRRRRLKHAVLSSTHLRLESARAMDLSDGACRTEPAQAKLFPAAPLRVDCRIEDGPAIDLVSAT
jgi:hypothetical protein